VYNTNTFFISREKPPINGNIIEMVSERPSPDHYSKSDGTWEFRENTDTLKNMGIEFQGVMCSATAEDQWGLASIESVVLAGMPVNFKFANGNSLVLNQDNWAAFRNVWLPFRASFFPLPE